MTPQAKLAQLERNLTVLAGSAYDLLGCINALLPACAYPDAVKAELRARVGIIGVMLAELQYKGAKQP